MSQAIKRIDWKVFGILLGAGLVGVVAILPYTFDLLGANIIKVASTSPSAQMSLWFVVPLALVQNGILLSIAILIGMVLSDSVGLSMPLIRAWSKGERAANIKAVLWSGMLMGAATGILMVAVEALFFLKHLPAVMLSLFDIQLWKRLLGTILYGGITEELLMRLFLLSLVAWLIGRLWKTVDGRPTSGAFWTAIVLVAMVFGLGHLPVTSAIAPLSQMLVVRALILNGIAGIAFGYLYWKRGLEAAMLGHMSAHLVMQIPGVMLLKAML